MTTNEGSHRIGGDENRPKAADTDRLRTDQSNRPDQSDRPDRTVHVGPYPQVAPVQEQRVLPAKTSAAAVFALVFGLSALLAVLTVILAPLALVLAIIGIILGIIGMKMAKRVGVTGRGVAIGGTVLAVIALILSITVLAGVTNRPDNQSAAQRINQQVQKLQDKLLERVNVPPQNDCPTARRPTPRAMRSHRAGHTAPVIPPTRPPPLPTPLNDHVDRKVPPELLKSRGNTDQAEQVDGELPDTVDIDKDAGLLEVGPGVAQVQGQGGELAGGS